MNSKLIKKQFEKSFDTYNKNAIVQQFLAEKLSSEVAKINKKFENVLELGCGTGLLTSELKNKISFEKYFANDIVEKSEKYVKNIIPSAQFYIGDARKIKPVQKMDLIISNAMFQWFENLEKVGEIYKNFLNKDGILAFSTFTKENYKEIKALTGLTLDYKTVEQIKDVFGKHYEILQVDEYNKLMRFDSPLELLAHMKSTGVNSLSQKHWTFKEIKDFCDRCKSVYPQITLTYAGLIFICKKI